MGTIAFVVIAFAFFGVLALVAVGISNAITKSASAAAGSVSRQFRTAASRPPAEIRFHSRLPLPELRDALIRSLAAPASPGVSNAIYLGEAAPDRLTYTFGNIMEKYFTALIRLDPQYSGTTATFAIDGRTEWAGQVQHVREMNDFARTFDACIRHIDAAAPQHRPSHGSPDIIPAPRTHYRPA